MFKLNILYRNWFVHNCFGHPLMYFAGVFVSVKLSMWIHDVTLPVESLLKVSAKED